MSPSFTDVVHRSRGQPTPKVLRGHNGSMAFVAFLSDEHILSASDGDNTIRRWTLSDGHNKLVREVMVCAVAMSHNRRWVAVGGRDGRVRLIDLQNPTDVKRTEVIRHADVVKSLSFSSNSSHLASGAHDGTVFIWSTETLEKVAGPFRWHKDAVWSICYSSDGKRIASCDREVVQIWDNTRVPRVGVVVEEPAWSLVWSSDGTGLFVGCIDGTIKRLDPDTGAPQASFKAHCDVISSIVLSHNGKFLVTASWDKTVRVLEATTFQHIAPVLPHDTQVYSVSLSLDGSRLVSGTRDSDIRVWNLRSIAPVLFTFFPFEPNRRPAKNGLHLPWGKPTMDSDCGHDDDNTANCHVREHANDSKYSIGSNDPDPASPTSKRSGSIRSVWKGLRDRGHKTDYSPTLSPSIESSCSPYTDEETQKSVPPPYYLHSPSPTKSTKPSSEGETGRLIETMFILSRLNLHSSRSNALHDLTSSIVQDGRLPVSGGSHGDTYKGMLNVNGRTMPVAIKVVQKYSAQGDDQSKQRRLRREIKLWLTLDHKNVMPLLGTTKNYGDFPAMVCPWAENGTLTEYLDRCSGDLTLPLRFCVINDVALGLQYLHSNSIVHGDISGSNILIYGSGRACISDIGLSMVVSDIEESSTAPTIRWAAPELLDLREPKDEDEHRSKIFPTVQSDTYSFAGIMLYVLSGKRPYHNLSRDEQVILAVSRREHPKRPTVVTDDQWHFMIMCWSFEPTERPSDSKMVAFVHDQLIDAVTAASRCEPSSRISRDGTLKGDKGL